MARRPVLPIMPGVEAGLTPPPTMCLWFCLAQGAVLSTLGALSAHLLGGPHRCSLGPQGDPLVPFALSASMAPAPGCVVDGRLPVFRHLCPET